MEFTKEQIEKAKNCKTLDEFKAQATAEGLNLTDAEAEEYFNATRVGALTDDDLSTVAGSGKGDPGQQKYPIGQYLARKSDNRHYRIVKALIINKEWHYDVRPEDGDRTDERYPESKIPVIFYLVY